MTLSDYQLQRVNDTRHWYETFYLELAKDVPVSIRYMVLWAIFNSLYNIADFPNVKLRRVTNPEGKNKPVIRGNKETLKIEFFSVCFVNNDQFTSSLIKQYKNFLNYLSRRNPEVKKPMGTTSIQFEHNNQSYELELNNLHGIASLDNRVFLQNGIIFFQYYYLFLDLNPDDLPNDRAKFYTQLIFMLYQLRNNIVQGGSAAFFWRKKKYRLV